MKRRDILKYTALATGAAISAPLLTSILSGCNTATVAKLPDYKPVFFEQGEFSVLSTLVDTILPKTDSPSAAALGVQNIIDTIVGTVYKEEERAKYKTNFSALLQYFNQGKETIDFDSIKDKISLENLKQLYGDTAETSEAARAALKNIKQQTVAFYLSTEEIGKNYLNYLPVPGTYEPCIQLKDVGGKAWSI